MATMGACCVGYAFLVALGRDRRAGHGACCASVCGSAGGYSVRTVAFVWLRLVSAAAGLLWRLR